MQHTIPEDLRICKPSRILPPPPGSLYPTSNLIRPQKGVKFKKIEVLQGPELLLKSGWKKDKLKIDLEDNWIVELNSFINSFIYNKLKISTHEYIMIETGYQDVLSVWLEINGKRHKELEFQGWLPESWDEDDDDW